MDTLMEIQDKQTKQYVVYRRVLRLLFNVMTALEMDTTRLPVWEDIPDEEENESDEEAGGEDVSDEEEDRGPSKPLPTTVNRAWVKCKEQVVWLEKQPIAKHGDPKLMLVEYHRHQQTIEKKINEQMAEYGAKKVLRPCQRRLLRLQQAMGRVNGKQAHDAYTVLMDEVVKLAVGSHLQNPAVAQFLLEVDRTVATYESTFKVQLTEKEAQRRAKLAAVRAHVQSVMAESKASAQAISNTVAQEAAHRGLSPKTSRPAPTRPPTSNH